MDKLKNNLKMKIQYCFDLHMEFHENMRFNQDGWRF